MNCLISLAQVAALAFVVTPAHAQSAPPVPNCHPNVTPCLPMVTTPKLPGIAIGQTRPALPKVPHPVLPPLAAKPQPPAPPPVVPPHTPVHGAKPKPAKPQPPRPKPHPHLAAADHLPPRPGQVLRNTRGFEQAQRSRFAKPPQGQEYRVYNDHLVLLDQRTKAVTAVLGLVPELIR